MFVSPPEPTDLSAYVLREEIPGPDPLVSRGIGNIDDPAWNGVDSDASLIAVMKRVAALLLDVKTNTTPAG